MKARLTSDSHTITCYLNHGSFICIKCHFGFNKFTEPYREVYPWFLCAFYFVFLKNWTCIGAILPLQKFSLTSDENANLCEKCIICGVLLEWIESNEQIISNNDRITFLYSPLEKPKLSDAILLLVSLLGIFDLLYSYSQSPKSMKSNNIRILQTWWGMNWYNINRQFKRLNISLIYS